MDTIINEEITAKGRAKKSKVKRVLLIITIVLAALVAALILFMAIYRTELRNSHAIDAPGTDLMETVEIGGIQQCLYFRGQNVDNPVILFLHGGPGSPEMPMLPLGRLP